MLKRTGYLLAVLILLPCLSSCVTTPSTSSWATDVYRIRLATLKPSMTTTQVLEAMGIQGPQHANGNSTTYDLTEGYALTLYFTGDRDHPQEVVLHTPYTNDATHWSRQLSDAELGFGAPTTKPLR